MTLCEAIILANREADDESTMMSPLSESRITKRVYEEFKAIHASGIERSLAQMVEASDNGDHMADLYMAVAYALRLGMRVQRKMDRPDEMTVTCWKSR